VRPNGSEEGGGIPDRSDRTARELCRVRNLGTGDRELEKDAEGGGGKSGIFMAVERPLNPEGVKHHDRNYS
jgi:hypothetical protein